MELESYYEIARVAEFVRSRSFTRVALQFPDELLKDSMRVVQALRQELGSSVKLYVMADTTYGSCCVDEVGAAHISAECVVHYGHTCLSSTSTIPALFIFEKALISPSNCARKLLDHGLKSGKPVLVLSGLEYTHAIPEIKKALASDASIISGSTSMLEFLYADVCCSVLSPSEKCKPPDQIGVGSQVVTECPAEASGRNYSIGGLSWRLPHGHKMEDYLLFWIGLDNPAFANVVLTFNSCGIEGIGRASVTDALATLALIVITSQISDSETIQRSKKILKQFAFGQASPAGYDATEDHLVTDLSQQKKVLMRRYYLVEKAKDANMIGILVGTLGAAGYLHMIHQMRELIAQVGKKSYTFVMGKPNPAKLANFPECDVFINVSCAQTAVLGSKDFLTPIITPFEAVLAFDRGSHWTGEYVMEFRDLIASTPVKREQSEEARFSFIQGGYVEDWDLRDDDEVDKNEILSLVSVTEKALQVRDEDTQSLNRNTAKSGAEYFASRSYHGLDINNTDSLPGRFLAGRSGKASGYKDEKAELSQS